MNRKDIIRMAREAGMNLTPAQFSGVLEDEVDEFQLERFAALVAAQVRTKTYEEAYRAGSVDEREACAMVCEGQRDLQEEARSALRVADAFKDGDGDTMLRAMRHESNVRLYNSGIDMCADAIRARGEATLRKNT